MPVGTLATGDHHQQTIGKMVEEKLQATVQHRPLSQVIIIQHQQQGLRRGQVYGQFVEQAVEPLFECERLMALAHFQQPEGLPAQVRKIVLKAFKQPLEKAPRVTVSRAQPQPETLPVCRQPLTELHRQRTLAEPCRGTDQQ
ncbi:hypothetical protein D9M71_309940 [compost metagenome]